MDYDFYPAKQVLPRVWVGSMRDAASNDFMRQHDIGLIVNCTRDVPAFHAGTIPTIRIPIHDHETSAPTLYEYAPAVVREMRKFLEKYPRLQILVHCAAGISRSSSTVAAYLILENRYTVQEAIKRIQQCKPETFHPRIGYIYLATP